MCDRFMTYAWTQDEVLTLCTMYCTRTLDHQVFDHPSADIDGLCIREGCSSTDEGG